MGSRRVESGRWRSRQSVNVQSDLVSVGWLLLHPTLSELPVEEEKRLALVSYHLEGLDDVAGVLLLLDLLGHEPLQEGLARVVVLLRSDTVEVVDLRRDLLLVLQSPLEDLQGRPELEQGSVYCPQHDAAVALQHEVVEFHRVHRLLLGLGAHPLREARKVLRLAVGGHREILVGRKKLVLDLLVHRVLDRFAKHGDPLLIDPRQVQTPTIPIFPTASLQCPTGTRYGRAIPSPII